MSSSIASSSLSAPEPSSASASTATGHASTASPPAPSTATSVSSPQDHPPPPPLPQAQHGAPQPQDQQQALPHPPAGGLGLGLVPHPDAAPGTEGAAGPSALPPAAAAPSSQAHQPPPPPPLQRALPRPSTQREIDEARAAVVASLGNMLDRELSSRAAALHANDAAIARQRRDVERSTAALRRENDRLAKEADGAARRLKEVGNVQNWAELLEKDFLVLEETLRLAREGGASSSGGSGSWTGSSSWSGSRTPSREGSRSGSRDAGGAREACPDGPGTGPAAAAAAAAPDLSSVPGQQKDADGDITMGDEGTDSSRVDKGKGKEIAAPDDGRSNTHAPENVGT
ncbi:uncharacterized protein E0L32_003203 [Thyridium curvatum]|uniref:Biogenesis of lysosome-related organelles complex 1 subunit 1 n=1 Tax=Thyridium curvatum TaxID=1093900 RepID=A0A507B1V1_9PEZI|nr:uncharacterized protein E0L32_003203 [Thyridium curvatum]TPX17085.1 hypothetical protein E0L32_003203 [Thyridium curvatum]